MPKWFNTAGPCKADIHYMLPPLARLPQLERLIAQQGYFVIHAPRQTGKTTAMIALAKQLNDSDQYIAVAVSVKAGSAFLQDIGRAEEAILADWRNVTNPLQSGLSLPVSENTAQGQRIYATLSSWAVYFRLPLVVLIDDIDSLHDRVLASVLSQIRSGHPDRPVYFPHALALISSRDVGNCETISDENGTPQRTVPFNIKVESLLLRDFTLEEITKLYSQYTQETGRVFTHEAVIRVFELTRGQPYLVNVIAQEMVRAFAVAHKRTIFAKDIDIAREVLA